MKSLLLLVAVLFILADVCNCQDIVDATTPTECHNCNEWVGIGTGLGVSFLVILVLLVLTIATVLLVKLRKRREGYEEFS